MLSKLLRELIEGKEPDRAALVRLLTLERPDELAELYAAAYAVKTREVGRLVRLRGLIEISNICTQDCCYCGIRRSNERVTRYAMTKPEILAAARLALEFGYGSVVLQGGERSDPAFVDFIEELLHAIKTISGGRLGITLSLGEQSGETFRRWFAAGAHRYLLRIESSNPRLFAAIHPSGQSFENRLRCLDELRLAGYQVGTGVMCGLPGQTADDLAGDIEFFKTRDIDMLGMGPYIPHRDTPMGRDFDYRPARQLEAGLKLIAATRLALRDVNIAATTALQTLAPDGRERGLLAGANVIMPNLGEVGHRGDYLLYEGKPGLDENAESTRRALLASIESIGEGIEAGAWGDSPHFARRLKR